MKHLANFEKPVKVISILIIIFLTAYMISVFSSMHAHILPDGKLVVHSHPHGNSHSDNSQKSNHSHTNKEYLIYGLYSVLLNNMIIGFAVSAFVINTVILIYNMLLRSDKKIVIILFNLTFTLILIMCWK